jgi:predicted dehydrogenase
MADLRFAILGTGFWARYQLAAWRELSGARCVALCDRVVSKAEALAREFDAPAVYADADDLLRREKLDFVDIISDPYSHSELVHLAAAHKIPVICQKPMGSSLALAEQMVKRCHEAGVPFYVHENWRWQPQIREFKQVLESGEIGTPFRAQIFMVSGYPVFIKEPPLAELEEFIVTDTGTHLLDTARFLFGEAESLYCQFQRVHANIKGEDVATIMMKMGGRTTVLCEMGYPENYLENDVFLQTLIFVEGDKGSAELDRDYWIRVTTKAGTMSRRCPPPWYSWMDPDYHPCHAGIVSCHVNLLQALQGKGQAETTGEDNLKTMVLTFAAYDSARSDATIQFR